MRGYSICARR